MQSPCNPFAKRGFAALFVLMLSGFSRLLAAESPQRPNVILIMSDDQGYCDLGLHGNSILRTPSLDAMAERSARWDYFYVSPVCTPTRACLMTGRYNYRTRAIDTYRGRAMIDPNETTLAELLHSGGYATGIFGKWHLGDCYPSRAFDQGFEMALVHRGGGIGQPSDPPGGEGKYTDPILFRNGKEEAHRGYCTDVYFTEGMHWADECRAKQRPYFLYLPTNAPHSPYHDVPQDKLAYYQQQKIAADRFPKSPGEPLPEKLNVDQLTRVYAMIENIDDNVGRLFDWLNQTQQTEQTLVIFITDNGPASKGWNSGLRGHKSDVFDGGIRSPAFFHWPKRIPAGQRTGRIAAHLDLLPTILEVCQVNAPKTLKLDGRSLWAALETGDADWPERTLFFQSHRGNTPFPRNHCAVRAERWKLVHPTGFGRESFEGEPKWMLFDMPLDPYEQHDVAAQHPEIVRDLQQQYDRWFADVSATRPDNYTPPRIIVGTDHESITVLTRQDWRDADWKQHDLGHWLIDSPQATSFEVRVRPIALTDAGTVFLQIDDRTLSQPIAAGTSVSSFSAVELTAGPHDVRAWTEVAEKKSGAMFVELERKR